MNSKLFLTDCWFEEEEQMSLLRYAENSRASAFEYLEYLEIVKREMKRRNEYIVEFRV